MFEIEYSSKNFPVSYGPDLTGTNTLQMDWPELVWAALSVGKAETRHLSRFGIYSWYELLMRLYLLRTNFKESIAGQLVQTAVYRALDPSEKNAVSYFMGLTMAKLLANRFLDVPWLIHLDSFDKTRLAFGSKKRPDLLGHNRHHQWLVMEAKGRSGKVKSDVMPKALLQTQAVKTIDSNSPFLQVASASFIESEKSGVLAAQWECPLGVSSGPGVKMDMAIQDFFSQYYLLFRNLLNNNNQPRQSTTGGAPGTFGFITASSLTNDGRLTRLRDFRFRTAYFPEFDITIGLLDQEDSFFVDNPGWYDDFSPASGDEIRGLLSPGLFVAPDGILVKLGDSWRSGNMREEPEQRN